MGTWPSRGSFLCAAYGSISVTDPCKKTEEVAATHTTTVGSLSGT